MTLSKKGKISIGIIAISLLVILLTMSAYTDSTPLICKESHPNKVGLELLGKNVVTAQGDTQFLRLAINFVNKSEKPIKVAKGELTIKDSSGNTHKNIIQYPRGYYADEIASIESIPVNSGKKEQRPLNYFKAIYWLNTTPLRNMECEWNVDQIVYDDGTEETF